MGAQPPLGPNPDAGRLLSADRRRRCAALARRAEVAPFTITGPITLEVSFLYRQPVEYILMLDGIERVDAFTIRVVHGDILALQRFMVFLLGYSATLQW